MSRRRENLHDQHQGHAHHANRHHRRVAAHPRRSGNQNPTMPGPWLYSGYVNSEAAEWAHEALDDLQAVREALVPIMALEL